MCRRRHWAVKNNKNTHSLENRHGKKDTALIAVLNTFKITLFHVLNTEVQARYQGWRNPPLNFSPPLEKCVGRSLKIFDIVPKIWVPLGKIFAPPGVLKLITDQQSDITNTHSKTALDTGMQRQGKAYVATGKFSAIKMPIVLAMHCKNNNPIETVLSNLWFYVWESAKFHCLEWCWNACNYTNS